MTIHDAHCHFFSSRFLEALGRETGRAADGGVSGIAATLGWDAPGEPEALADRWVAELDSNHVSRVALMASVPGDEESVSVAVRKHPDRLVGLFNLNPTAPDATD